MQHTYSKNNSWLPKIDNFLISEKMWVGSSSSEVSQESASYSNICRGKNGRTSSQSHGGGWHGKSWWTSSTTRKSIPL